VVQTTRVGTAWSKISGLQPELAYLARAQVIVGSNPTRPTTGSGSGAKLRSTVLVHAACGWLWTSGHEPSQHSDYQRNCDRPMMRSQRAADMRFFLPCLILTRSRGKSLPRDN